MNEKYLPLGSVVLLKKGKHCLSIIGFCLVVKNENNRQYDYSAVPYPEGFLGKDSVVCFDHEDIQEILSIGFSNDDEKKFKERLKKVSKMILADGDEKHISNEKLIDVIGKEFDKYEQY